MVVAGDTDGSHGGECLRCGGPELRDEPGRGVGERDRVGLAAYGEDGTGGEEDAVGEAAGVGQRRERACDWDVGGTREGEEVDGGGGVCIC